jgi:hypothetical protein
LRLVATEQIMEIAASFRNRQFIFITPQDVR